MEKLCLPVTYCLLLRVIVRLCTNGFSCALPSVTASCCCQALLRELEHTARFCSPVSYLLTMVKRRKLQWYGHVSRSSGLSKTIMQGTVNGGKKTRQTEEEVGRQHQGMDRPGVRQVPEGSGEQGKMEETGCEIICGAPTTLMVKG